ncbi:S8 family peptidase [Actinoplanes sp. KI2]|uniref:S8 family peptidase n=1 Tax=Actinoplanes sp. KI2 TaxID=2983315 RepID=UPI0021D59B05|nr:S8 family peptidase [Actinoplanes sp. KI2]MCU7725133.1 S8 family peptidase [Actinoplanes sp. KI2]
MRKHLRRYALSALAVGAAAGASAFALPSATADWTPATYGLTSSPAQLLPAKVSAADPVRVVSTTIDSHGRPVVKVRTATSTSAAAALVKQAQQAKDAVGVEVDAPMKALAVDPYRSQQWDLAKMNVPAANARSTGSGVTVAVVDTGVDASHPDLAGQVLPGIDIVNGSTTGVSTDPNGHGTHVAGTIAALTGNGVGVASVAPGVKILPVRVLDANGSGYMSDAATGIVWAADHGATVINLSLGSTSQVSAVTNAVSYARGKGVTVVAAAGNDRAKGSPTSWPAADAGVIAVAATDSADTVADYSNQGSYVDVAAPGSEIVSTYPVAKGSYATMDGTSMATPHVAAEAALLKAYDKSLTPDQIEKTIESTAVDLGKAGKDTDYGYGRVDAAAALQAVTPAASAPTTAPTTTASPAPSTTSTSPAPTPTDTVVPKVKPAIAVTPAVQQVAYGTRAKVAFTVTAGGKAMANRPVRVCVAAAGAAAKCGTTHTGTDGRVVVSRVATAGYKLNLRVDATDTTEAVTSAPAVVTVKAGVAVVRSGKSMTVALQGPAGQKVLIQHKKGTHWVTMRSYPARAKTKVSGLATGQHYRVVVPGIRGVVGVTSATV